jgi:MFS family permease
MGWRIVPLLMLYVALAHFNRLSMSVAGTKIIASGLLTEVQMGWVYSTFLIVYTLAMIPAGWLIDRLGPWLAWIALGIGSAAGTFFTGVVGLSFAGSAFFFASLLTIRALMGPTNAPLHPAAARLVGNWVPVKWQSLGNGLVTFAACAGMASTFQIFGRLVDKLGWPHAFLVTGSFTAIVVLLWGRVGSDSPSDRPANKAPVRFDDVLDLLTNRRLVCLTLSYGAVGYFQYLFFYWAEHYFEKVQLYSQDDSRNASSLLTLTLGVGMVLGGFLSDRAVTMLGRRWGAIIVPMLGLLVAAAATVAGAYGQSPAEVVIGFTAAMGAIGMCEASYWAISVSDFPGRGGTAAAITNTGGNAVGLLAPVVTPMIASARNWESALLFAAGVCIVGSALWLGVKAEIATKRDTY